MISSPLSPIWTSGAGFLLSVARELSNHLWQSTLVAGLLALLALALRNYQARARYWLWFAASAKFITPFSLLVFAGSHLPWTIQPHPLQDSAYRAVNQVSQPFTDVAAFETPAITSVAQPSASQQRTPALAYSLAAFWFCGFAAVLSAWVVQWRRLSATMRAAAPLREGREFEALRRIERQLGLRTPIEMLSSSHSMEPGIFGIVHPLLLWPKAVSAHLDDAHLEAVLAHEVFHVQRRDNLTSLLHLLVEAVFWFFPPVWWIEKRLVEERERACDEAVVQLCSQPHVYAESILKVCELCVESPLTCVSGITGADLKQRIRTIMAQPVWLQLNFRKKLLLFAGALAIVAAPVAVGLRAQAPTASPDASETHARGDISGTWQGTMALPRLQLRAVLKIAKKPDGGWGVVFYNIDQNATPLNATDVTFSGGTFKYTLPAMGATYEGRLSADDNAIEGTISIGAQSSPLTYLRATKETAWAIPEPPKPPKQMAADADPDFEVATIKPNSSGAQSMQIGISGRDFTLRNGTLGDMIAFAYGVQKKQITNAPDWMDKDHYDIAATTEPEGQPNPAQLKTMLRKMLAGRFKLTVHQDQHEMSAFVLSLDKGGNKLTPSQSQAAGPGFRIQPAKNGVGLMAQNATLDEFAQFLQTPVLDRPVVNHTGIEGRFDLSVTFTPDSSEFGGRGPRVPTLDDGVEPAPDLLMALQQQLGLKLNTEKTEVDMVAIDRVEKPSEN